MEEDEIIAQEREKALREREMRLLARETLAEKGLDGSLLNLVNLTDSESCLRSIEALENSLNAEVDRRLKSRGMTLPAAAASVDEDSMTDSEYYAYVRAKGM